MSWVAVAVGVGGAAAGYFGQRDTNRQNARAASGQGYVDSTTRRDPYEGTQGYREAAMQAAYESLFGRGEAPVGRPANGAQVQGAPAPPASPVASTPTGTGKAPAGMRWSKNKGKFVPAKPGAPGAPAAGATPAPAPFKGQSAQTADLVDRMANDLPADNQGLYDIGEEYVAGSLGGKTTNPLLDRATSAADDIAEDPRLAAFQDAIMAELGIGGKSGAGGAGRSGPSFGGAAGALAGPRMVAASASGAPLPQGPTSSSATGADAALRKLIAGEKPQGWDEMESSVSRRVNEGRADNIRQLRARAVGSGFYGGDLYKELETGAIAQGDQELADSLSAARYQAFSDALGLGTQYDLGMADIAARDRATSASAGAAASGLAAQEKLAKMGMLGDLLQLGEQGRFGKASQLGDLAGLVSADQRAALGGISDITGGRRSDLGAAGSLSIGSDEARNAWQAARGSESVGHANARVGMEGVKLGRDELGFERERFYDPFARISAYTGILGNLYDGFGSETTTGRDTRSTAPPAFSSPWGAALSGAAIGGQVGGAFQASRRGAAA